jgi:hypothetical protein
MLTKEFFEDQIIKLSDERDKARLRLAEARIELDRSRELHKKAFDTLDCLDGLIIEFQRSLEGMETQDGA